MKAKKAITTILSIGGMIGLGVLCKNKISPKAIEKTVEVVNEPMFNNIPLSKLQENYKKLQKISILKMNCFLIPMII